MVCDILPSQDASTHLIWNSYLKEYRSFAPDLMPILETRSEVKVIVTGKWNDPPFQDAFTHQIAIQDAFTHQIWNSYLKECKRSAPDTIILKTRSKVNVTVTRIWYVTLRHPMMHFHTKFGIPTSKNLGDMHQTQSSF